jgi:hypothetical protein
VAGAPTNTGGDTWASVPTGSQQSFHNTHGSGLASGGSPNPGDPKAPGGAGDGANTGSSGGSSNSEDLKASGGTLAQTGEQGATENTNRAIRIIKVGWLWEFTALMGLWLYMVN